MNPNQPNNFQSYSNQFKPNQFNNYQYTNQPHLNQNTLNIPKNNFHQGGSLSPTDNHQINRGKIDRAMYSSTIEGTLPSKSFALGKLQTMGRFIGSHEQPRNQPHKQSYQFQPNNAHNGSFGFQQQRQKTFEPFVPSNRQTEFDRFPSFNLNDNHAHQQPFNSHNFQGQTGKSEHQQTNSAETLTPEQKRKRQIMAIKQELQMINKKMQSTNLNKKYGTETDKHDFKPPANNSPTNNSSNNYLTPTSNGSTSGSSTGSSYGVSNYDNGMSFNRPNNNQLSVGQRNKGLVTQSMIVSNEPSTGFKYQSIFDKYDSMKKPTYETMNNEVKEERPSLLDKFVHKGPGSEPIKPKQPETYSFSNGSSSSSQQSNNTGTFDFSSSSKNNQPSSSFSSNYGLSSNTSNTSSYGSAMTFGNTNSQQPKQGGGMFKKKKFGQQVKTEFTATQQKTPDNETNHMFKKATKPQYQENIVTNAMKQMKIEESVDFKRDDFVVGKKLGKGQFGQVMLVQHKKTGFLCGMKVMEKKQIRDEKYEGQITRELSIQFYLAHRNITPLYGYFQDEKNVYLLIEYCTGGQLLEMLRKNRRMQEPQVSRIIKQIIEGIDYIHKELIIHRDIKPENILFNFGIAKICDFGWAVYKGHGMRKTASVGSPLYYSPEIVMGVQYDEKIDIWDIGMMTYECLLGKIPFRIYSELDLNRIVQDEIKFPQYIDTTQEAKDFILRIMKKKPEERMEIREMLRHPFITKYQDQKLPVEIMKDFKEVLS